MLSVRFKINFGEYVGVARSIEQNRKKKKKRLEIRKYGIVRANLLGSKQRLSCVETFGTVNN